MDEEAPGKKRNCTKAAALNTFGKGGEISSVEKAAVASLTCYHTHFFAFAICAHLLRDTLERNTLLSNNNRPLCVPRFGDFFGVLMNKAAQGSALGNSILRETENEIIDRIIAKVGILFANIK